MNTPAKPLRILISDQWAEALRSDIDEALQGRPCTLLSPSAPESASAEIAFVSRDVTGLSTKHELQPATRAFYDAMSAATGLQWVHTHSAGADRAIFQELLQRGVRVTTSSGANAEIVAHTALAGLLALARHLPELMAAQRERRWASLMASGLPRDLRGQTAVLVGWGPIGQHIGRLLQALGMTLVVVRQSGQPAGAGIKTVAYEKLHDVLPTADWVVLACPLSTHTERLINAAAFAKMPEGARLVNVSRGEVVDEPALVDALKSRRLAGAFLDVFAHEPLPADSPLWSMDHVIATPHSAGFADSNEARVASMFLANLKRWVSGEALINPARRH